MKQKIVFLDRDGVINKEKNYLYKIADFVFIAGVFSSCRYLQKLGYKLIIITNQSGIGRGYYEKQDFYQVNDWMLNKFKENGVNILDVFFCPHAPEDNCKCRKPSPKMLTDAQKKHNIDMDNSWMIGDKEADIVAANNAGIKDTILVESGHKIDKTSTNAKFILKSIKNISKIIK